MEQQTKEIQLPDEFSVEGKINYNIEYKQEDNGIGYYVNFDDSTETHLVFFTAVNKMLDDMYKDYQERKRWLKENKKHKDYRKVKTLVDVLEGDRDSVTRAKFICGKIAAQLAEPALHNALYKANEAKQDQPEPEAETKPWWKKLLRLK